MKVCPWSIGHYLSCETCGRLVVPLSTCNLVLRRKVPRYSRNSEVVTCVWMRISRTMFCFFLLLDGTGYLVPVGCKDTAIPNSKDDSRAAKQLIWMKSNGSVVNV